jgi:predicted transcriptional regulator
MWLHENRQASAAVCRGLADAKAGRLTAGPDLAADAPLADRLRD